MAIGNLAKIEQQNTQLTFTQQEIQMIHQQCAKGTTQAEFQHFIYVATLRGLNPLANQFYCIVRGQDDRRSITHQVGIDGFRAIADRTEKYAGSDDPIYGMIEEQPYYHPETATVTVWKIVQGVRCGFTATARWTEYKPAAGKSGNADRMWKQMPFLMLSKCAEALALRKAFPQDLSGLYEPAELDQSPEPVIEEKPVKKISRAEQYACSESVLLSLKAVIADAESEGIERAEMVKLLPKGTASTKQLDDARALGYIETLTNAINETREARQSERDAFEEDNKR